MIADHVSDADLLAEAIDHCPCGETGHPREQCDPAYLAELDAMSDADAGVPDGPGYHRLCWNCRRLASYSSGPYGDFARRVAAIPEPVV